MESLKEKTGKGLLWSAINNGFAQICSLILGIFLARLLTPSDYGIVGVLSIFISLGGAMQASGFNTGLINLKSPQPRDYNAVFWFSMGISILIYAIFFVSAPLIASFFHQPCLVNLSRVLFLTLPMSAFGISYGAYMTKRMMNREMAFISIVSLVVSGVLGVLAAWKGMAYWSLVIQQLSYIMITNIGRIYYVPWHPVWQFDFEPIRRMVGFCSRILVTHVASLANQNILTFVFGRLFPIHAVGNFSQANKWSLMTSNMISNTVGQISQTVMVSVVDEEEREVRVFRKLVRFMAFFCFPVMFGLVLVSHEFVLTTIGQKWEKSIPLLQILCIGGAFSPFYILYQHLVISKQRSDLYMWNSVGHIVMQLMIALFMARFGIKTVVFGYSVLNILWLFVWQFSAYCIIGHRTRHMLLDIMPFACISALVMLMTNLLTTAIMQPVILLLSRVLISSTLYVFVMKLLKVEILDECLSYFRKICKF